MRARLVARRELVIADDQVAVTFVGPAVAPQPLRSCFAAEIVSIGLPFAVGAVRVVADRRERALQRARPVGEARVRGWSVVSWFWRLETVVCRPETSLWVANAVSVNPSGNDH